MKKLIISFSLMLTILASTVSVFATYYNVSDSWHYNEGKVDNGLAYLKGRRDSTTDALSGVYTDSYNYGNARITFENLKKDKKKASVNACGRVGTGIITVKTLRI